MKQLLKITFLSLFISIFFINVECTNGGLVDLNNSKIETSITRLAGQLKLDGQPTQNALEKVEFTLRLLEKSQQSSDASQFQQEIYSSLHPYLANLARTTMFNDEYQKNIDLIEKLFNTECTIEETGEIKKPFRFPLIYSLLALTKITLENPESYEQINLLKNKISIFFKNAYYRNKKKLHANHPPITLNDIYHLINIIYEQLPTDNSPSLLNPTNWNWNYVACGVAAVCTIVLTVFIVRTLNKVDIASNNFSHSLKNIDRSLGNPENPTSGTLAKVSSDFSLSLEKFNKALGDSEHPARNTLAQAIADFSQSLRNVDRSLGDPEHPTSGTLAKASSDFSSSLEKLNKSLGDSEHPARNTLAQAIFDFSQSLHNVDRSLGDPERPTRNTLALSLEKLDATLDTVQRTLGQSEAPDQTLAQNLQACRETMRQVQDVIGHPQGQGRGTLADTLGSVADFADQGAARAARPYWAQDVRRRGSQNPDGASSLAPKPAQPIPPTSPSPTARACSSSSDGSSSVGSHSDAEPRGSFLSRLGGRVADVLMPTPDSIEEKPKTEKRD
ncbi:TPA: hypothetical protein DEO28_00220 [Candidatus Dependentiae bacterium]|nr:MAG: hypothetical protein UR14_C0001G0099 [candidate division TM6 bacterium GW2011_GWE2_31_21]KKP54021.1 MAG: hypothetical protein UR43_C0001G0039 [candidate division TM6 bacterium GW2011_GWF2_33_332]HBS48397.1 hypothetical protein [Candidatus Dependentiae bacterium]HBZ72929.1 hypothetical protein [Candidatus Dependentiae bacterium]